MYILSCTNCGSDSEQPNVSMLCSTKKKSAFYPQLFLASVSGSCAALLGVLGVGILWPWGTEEPWLLISAWQLSPCSAVFPKDICFICCLLHQLIGKVCSFPLQWEFESCQVGEYWLVMIWLFIKSSLIQNSWVKYITATLSDSWTICQTSTSDTTGIFPLNFFSNDRSD